MPGPCFLVPGIHLLPQLLHGRVIVMLFPQPIRAQAGQVKFVLLAIPADQGQPVVAIHSIALQNAFQLSCSRGGAGPGGRFLAMTVMRGCLIA